MTYRRHPTGIDAIKAYLRSEGQVLTPQYHQWELTAQVSIRWRKRWVVQRRLRQVRIDLVGTLPSIWISDLEPLGLAALRPYSDLHFSYNARQGCLSMSSHSDAYGGAPCLFRLRHPVVARDYDQFDETCPHTGYSEAERVGCNVTACPVTPAVPSQYVAGLGA